MTTINPNTADKVNPIAPSKGMPFTFGGISVITKRAEPMIGQL